MYICYTFLLPRKFFHMIFSRKMHKNTISLIFEEKKSLLNYVQFEYILCNA